MSDNFGTNTAVLGIAPDREEPMSSASRIRHSFIGRSVRKVIHTLYHQRNPAGKPVNYRQVRFATVPPLAGNSTSYDGYLDGNDGWTASGWAFDGRRPDTPLVIEFYAADEKIGHVLADQVRPDLQQYGNGVHAFCFRLPPTIGQHELLTARIAGSDFILKGSPMPRAPRQSISLSGDIVNQCNLRCPFCMVDYTNFPSVKRMPREIYDRTLQLLPITARGRFWLSCLHEPTLHPQFVNFIEAVPEVYRDRVSFTTNLARRIDDDLLSRLAYSGIDEIRVSFDSLDAAVLSELRKKAKFDVFRRNLLDLSAALRQSRNRPRLHFITMPFKDNYREVADIVRFGRDLGADSHEIRYVYYRPHLAKWGRDHILDPAEWAELERSLAPLAWNALTIAGPPADTVENFLEERGFGEYVAREVAFANMDGQPATIPDPARAGPLFSDTPLRLRLRWDGLIVSGMPYTGVESPRGGEAPSPPEPYFKVNVIQLEQPAAYFDALQFHAADRHSI
jgi:molybdenum cofactor biosynthesis enzyme MoaA